MTCRIGSAAVFLLLGTLGLSALQNVAGAGPAAPQKGTTRDPAAYQAKLEKEVRHVLLLLPYYSVFDNLAFKVEGDKVTLLGQVVRPSTKSEAEADVKKIEGVASVDNQIEVLPAASPMDDRLRRAVFRAIYSDPMLERYSIQSVPPIHIIVKSGRVTLEGVVSSEADKNVAYIRASGVAGVFSVTNNLRVEK